MLIGDRRVKCGGIRNRKEQQAHVRGSLQHRERRSVSVFGKPDRIRQANQNPFMMDCERLSAKQSIAESLRLLLKHVEDLGCIVTLGEVTNQISLLCRDHHADLRCARRDHSLHKIFSDCLRALGAFDQTRADGQQLL